MALTELYTLDVFVGGLGPVRVIGGSLTATEDETIYEPPPGESVFLLAEYYAEATAAANPTYKSGITELVTPEIAENQGVRDKVSKGFICASEQGQDLIVNAAENVSSVLYHVVVGKGMRL